ncbi:hypothetical protein M2427_008232 [Bradyrhizobium sp. BR13661]|jgi:hypothetical protein|nr:hypothetical protein [Bradyrhizobium sp. BR13661]
MPDSYSGAPFQNDADAVRLTSVPRIRRIAATNTSIETYAACEAEPADRN